ncbi:MAG: bifunctional riboflavin kinase/FAD synthetase [Oscillospiraceae bacterium]|nr:bifunctional riboflavin kinase/FAD synthetase [Oscillospiraceae bacterium]
MRNEKRVFALGFFDGVHLGHQALLRECVSMADRLNCRAAAITFDRHPQSLFSPTPPALISTARSRSVLLQSYGIEYIHEYPVVKEVMSMHWRDFLQQLMDMGAAGFVCGHDFRFGNRGEGNADKLRALCIQLGLPCVIVPEQTVDGVRISSTHIRSLIEGGKMETAVKFLGHPHMISGTVVHGKSLGRTLGIPTANLVLEPGLVVPKFGVYACRCIVDGESWPAVTNVGTRPTVNGVGVTVEPWILDFDGDLYGREITLEFNRFLRPETKFDGLSALQAQIRKDAEETRKYFEK